jgi:hypothetical protein
MHGGNANDGSRNGDFLERAKAILTESARAGLVSYLASNPEAGQLIHRTGGAGKSDGPCPAKENGEARGCFHRSPRETPRGGRPR